MEGQQVCGDILQNSLSYIWLISIQMRCVWVWRKCIMVATHKTTHRHHWDQHWVGLCMMVDILMGSCHNHCYDGYIKAIVMVHHMQTHKRRLSSRTHDEKWRWLHRQGGILASTLEKRLLFLYVEKLSCLNHSRLCKWLFKNTCTVVIFLLWQLSSLSKLFWLFLVTMFSLVLVTHAGGQFIWNIHGDLGWTLCNSCGLSVSVWPKVGLATKLVFIICSDRSSFQRSNALQSAKCKISCFVGLMNEK